MKIKAIREKVVQTAILNQWSPINMPCGGRMVGSEIIHNSPEGAEETLRATKELQDNSAVPLLVPADLEAGAGFAISALTKLPYLMGIGATGDLTLAYNFGLITGKEARSVGINWAFAPVCDLNINPQNPVTNMRSIGDNPEKAIPMLKEVIRGMQDGGIAACMKHFPGDGVDYRDQHITTSYNYLSYEEYMQNHGRVFSELAKIAYTAMVGHISLPCFQKERIDGLCPPASLSKEIMVDLLRNEMGFKGVVVSDALNMGGYMGWYKDERESQVISFKNGCDMMLWPGSSYVDDVVSAVENGFIPESRVDESYNRIMELKEKLGLLGGKYTVPLTSTDKEFISQASEEIYNKSITLECDKNKQLPLGKDVKKIAIFSLGGVEKFNECVECAKNIFEEYGMEIKVYDSIWVDNMKGVAKEYDKILFLLFTQPHQPAGPLDFFGKNVSALWSALCFGKEKTIVVSFGSPYFKNQYFERANTFINAYTPDKYAVEHVIRTMMTKFDYKGKSPVKL